MATAYNVRNRLAQSSNADRASRVDPGSAGTIIVSPVDRATVVLTGAGTRTLEAAAGIGVGTEILCVSQTNGVVVNGVTLNDGEYAIFRVTLDSAGANQWVVVSSTAVVALDATFPVNVGAYALVNPNTAADNAAALLQLETALFNAGVVTPLWTQV